jgi:chemotaxis signal transduction protein
MVISHSPSRDGQRSADGRRVAQKRLAYMVVRFPTLNLAFDMAQLQQVLPMPAVEYSPTLMLGVAQVSVGSAESPIVRPLIVVDLHCKLYDASLESPAHLLLFAAPDGLLYGIPVATLPEIAAIPEDLLLPPPDRGKALDSTLGLTRQLVKLPSPTGEQTLFIVDVQQLVQEVRHMAFPA